MKHPEAAIQALKEACLHKEREPERVFGELCQLLQLATAEDLLGVAPILGEVIPELGATIGFQQHSPHHAYDVFTHTAYVVENVPADLPLRWAALLHDIGKVPTFTRDETGRGHFYGHAAKSAEIADGVLRRLKAPADLREQVVMLIEMHMTKIETEKKAVRRALGCLGEQAMEALLQLQQADMGSKGTGQPVEMAQFAQIRQIMAQIKAENACLSPKDLAVNGHDLTELGFRGKEIGEKLNLLLEKVLEEEVANEKEALLECLKSTVP